MKNISKLLPFILCLFIVTSCSSNKNSEAIKAEAEKMNKSCPVQIDFLTTIDKIEFKSPKTIVYNYILTLKSESATELQNFKEGSEINSKYTVLYNDNFKYLKSLGATFEFRYKSADGKDLLNYTIDPDFYLNEDSEYRGNLSDEKVLKLLQQSAMVMNSQTPNEIIDGLSMINVVAHAPRNLEYIYRFDNKEKSELDVNMLTSSKAKDQLIETLKQTRTREAILFDNHVTFKFTYNDKNDDNVATILITPDDYKN